MSTQQAMRLPDDMQKMPQLFVTFYRKSGTPIEARANVSPTASDFQASAEQVQTDHNDDREKSLATGHVTTLPMAPSKGQEPFHDWSNLAASELENSHAQRKDHLTSEQDDIRSIRNATASISPLNEEQQAIVRDFVEILSSIGGIKASGSKSHEVNDQQLRVSPSSAPSAYSADIFQSYFTCHIPSQVTPFNPRQYNLKALRIHPSILSFETKHNLELILDLFTPYPSPNPTLSIPAPSRPIRLALFDMDSTLILEEVIDELARSIGAYDAVSAITSRAMADPTFDFAASLRARVALLKGVPADVWSSLRQKVHIAPGARELISGLKARGCVTGVISGGFTPMAEWLKGELGLDLAFANHLAVSAPTAEFDYEHLTGELDFSDGKVIVTPELKRDTLIAEAARRDIPMELTLAAGDGSNDLKMLSVAGLGVAWNAKPKTQEQAPMRLNRGNLSQLLCLLGPGGV